MAMQPTDMAISPFVPPGAVDVIDEQGIPVALCTKGVAFPVLTSGEEAYLKAKVERYQADYRFINESDLAELDRMLILDVLCYRYGHYLSRSVDYFDEAVDEKSLATRLADWSGEIRQIKKALGIDKVSRDKQRSEDSVAEYLAKLRERAQAFGVMREGQLHKGIELVQELIALITLMDNCDEVERRELHVTEKDIFEWLRTMFIPEFQAVDAYFREHDQRFWIRRQ